MYRAESLDCTNEQLPCSAFPCWRTLLSAVEWVSSTDHVAVLWSNSVELTKEGNSMGGQNHQPCNKYLHNSTQISLEVSKSRASLENANAQLEYLILEELKGGRSTARPIVGELGASLGHLRKALDHIANLRAQMNKEGYQDLPPLSRLDLDALGGGFVRQGMVCPQAWSDVAGWSRAGGFYKVLDEFEQCLVTLQQKTEDLRDGTLLLEELARSGEVEQLLETNGEGNIKRVFAEVYSLWHWFGARFLASSMLSTEVWYNFSQNGSLLDTPAALHRIA